MSTGSLVDVDSQSVRTVPSDFMEQDIQTETQAARLQQEEDAAAATAREKARREKEKAKSKAKKADNWLSTRIASLTEGQSAGIVTANLAAVVGLGAVLGYKAWGLHERGQFSWKTAGVGAGIVVTVGVIESVLGQ